MASNRKTEIVDVEDGKQIFVYTEDKAILEKLRDKATKIQWYEQWLNLDKPDPIKVKTIGVALYFPKTRRESLDKTIARIQKGNKFEKQDKDK